jgi:hypothetical protein
VPSRREGPPTRHEGPSTPRHEGHATPAQPPLPFESRGQSNPPTLSEADVEAVARRVVELLVEERARGARLASAAELARVLGVERSWVYDHAADLGAMRLGDGPRARLRFDVDRALALWTARCAGKGSHPPGCQQVPEDSTPARPRRGRRVPARLPETGSVLRVGPRGRGGPRADRGEAA